MAYNGCKVISFVSFKGGSGRSVALANTAYQLAKRWKVGCVDFDIEGGGLHKILEIGSPDKDSLQHYLMDEEDLADFLQTDVVPDYSDEHQFNERLVIDIIREGTSYLAGDETLHGEMYLIQAQPNADLTGRVDTGMNMFFRFDKLLSLFAQSRDLDYILVDCRSGISNLGLPGLAYCDLVALFLRWGTQHRYGTEAFLEWYENWLKDAGMRKKIVLVPSSIDLDTVGEEHIRTYLQDSLKRIPDAYKVIPKIDVLASSDVVLSSGDWKDQQLHYSALANCIIETLE